MAQSILELDPRLSLPPRDDASSADGIEMLEAFEKAVASEKRKHRGRKPKHRCRTRDEQASKKHSPTNMQSLPRLLSDELKNLPALAAYHN